MQFIKLEVFNMPSLINKSHQKTLAKVVKKATSFSQRAKGLIGKKSLQEDWALWIPFCKSVHTFFMSLPIDVIFVDKNFCVVSVFYNVPPYRILFGGFKSCSVFEMKAHSLNSNNIKKGDCLYVVD